MNGNKTCCMGEVKEKLNQKDLIWHRRSMHHHLWTNSKVWTCKKLCWSWTSFITRFNLIWQKKMLNVETYFNTYATKTTQSLEWKLPVTHPAKFSLKLCLILITELTWGCWTLSTSHWSVTTFWITIEILLTVGYITSFHPHRKRIPTTAIYIINVTLTIIRHHSTLTLNSLPNSELVFEEDLKHAQNVTL
jgi:hypothetical protein